MEKWVLENPIFTNGFTILVGQDGVRNGLEHLNLHESL